MAANSAVGILHRNIGCCHPHFPGRADGNYSNLVSVFFCKGFNYFIVAFAHQFCIFLNRNPVIVHMEPVECVFLGQTFNNESLNAQSGKKLSSSTSGIAFFDSAGQRAFSTGRKPP